MSLTVDSFRHLAASHSASAVVELSAAPSGGLAERGFWSRLFSSASAQAAKNQAVLDEFCRTIGREMGGDLGQAAKALLGGAIADRKPLSGYLIQATLNFLEQEKGRISQHNQDVAARYLTPPPGEGKSGLQAALARELPPGVELAEADTSMMSWSLLRFAGATTGKAISTADLDTQVSQKYHKALNNTSRAFLDRLDGLGRTGLPPTVSGGQIQALRPLIIASGVREEGDLRAALELMAKIQDRLPETLAAKTGVDVLELLKNLNADMPREGVSELGDTNVVRLAIWGAMGSGGADAKVMALGGVLSGAAGQEAGAVLLAARQGGDGAAQTLAEDLATVFTRVTTSLAELGAVDPEQMAAALAPTPREAGELSPEVRAYSHLSGLASPDPGEKKVMEAFNFIRAATNIPTKDLARLTATLTSSLGLGGPARGYPMMEAAGLLFTLQPEMRLAQPDGRPFTPKTVWNAVFGRDPGPDVTPDNLGSKLGAAWKTRVADTLLEHGVEDSLMHRSVTDNLTAILSYGVNPLKALALLAARRPEEQVLRFSDISLPMTGSPPGPPLAAAEEKAIQAMVSDLHRMEESAPNTRPTLTVGGQAPIQLHGGAIADAEQRLDYQQSGRNNPIIASVTAAVRGLCGDGEAGQAQRTRVFGLLSQDSTVLFRYAPIMVGADAAMNEHSPCNINVERLDNGNLRLSLETTPGIDGYGRLEYEIDAQGGYRQTDCRISRNRPE